jgi:hypothetical protein
VSSSDPLAELLQRADADAPTLAPLPADLPQRVRQAALRRRSRRVVIRSAAACLLLAIGASLAWQSWPRPPAGQPQPVAVRPRPATDPQALVAEIARLERDAAFHMAIADRTAEEMKRLRQPSRRGVELAARRPDPVVRAMHERDAASFVLVQRADRLQRERGRESSAIEAYLEIIRLMPESAGAKVARQRLADIQNFGGSTS